MARWISDLAAQRQAFRAKLDEGQGLKVPNEDPDWDDVGEALPRVESARAGRDPAATQAADQPIGQDPPARRRTPHGARSR